MTLRGGVQQYAGAVDLALYPCQLKLQFMCMSFGAVEQLPPQVGVVACGQPGVHQRQLAWSWRIGVA